MVKITQEISNKIANLGVLGAVMVVMIHIPKCAVGHNAIMYKTFPDCFWGAAVPMFFIISGFLIAGHVGEKGWWRVEVAKRWKSLVIPYCVLNTLLFVGMVGYKVSTGGSVNALSYLNALGLCPGEQSNNPIVGPLWYVRCLVLAVLTLPIFLPVLRRGRVYAGGLITGLILTGTFIGGHGGFLFSSVYRLWGVGYFLLGVALRIYGLPRTSRMTGFSCLVFAWTLSLSMEFVFGGNVGPSKLFVKLLVVVGLWGVIPTSAWPKVLTRNSFAIYAIHGMITYSAWIFIERVGYYNVIFGNPVTYYLFPVLLICGILVGVEFLRRMFPRVSELILGGR